MPEILERIRVQPEHDPDRFSRSSLASRPAGLPDPGEQTGGFARAVKKYRAYLRDHPQDAGAWESLGYLHLRMASGEGTGKGVGAEGLISAEVSDSPLRAGHQLLSFQCELQALLCAPASTRSRSSLNTTLSLALTDAERENPYKRGHYVGIVHSLGGVKPAQQLRLAVVEGLLELEGRSARGLDRSQEAEFRRDLALLHQDMGEHELALALLERVLALLDQERADGEPLYILDHAYVYLYMHLSALELRDWSRATEYLDRMEAEEQEEDRQRLQAGEAPLHDDGPATALRLGLLEAQERHVEARELAGENAEMLLTGWETSGVQEYGWGMVRCATLLAYAGRDREAVALLERIVAAPDDRHTREYALRTLDELSRKGDIQA